MPSPSFSPCSSLRPLLLPTLLLGLLLVPFTLSHESGRGCSVDGVCPFRVAVVGGGVAGTSAAYHLQKYFSSVSPTSDSLLQTDGSFGALRDADGQHRDQEREFLKEKGLVVDIWEREEYVGGRVHSVEVDGVVVELGADVYHDKNLLIVSLLEALGLAGDADEVSGNDGEDVFGAWNGDQFDFVQSQYEAVTIAKLLWQYGLDSYYLNSQTYADVDTTWQLQYGEAEKAWRSVSEFRDRYNLGHLMNTTTYDYFVKENGYRSDFIEQIVGGISHGIYQQETRALSALAGIVAVVGSGSNLLHINGGNQKLPEALARASGASILYHTPVDSVELLPSGKYLLKSSICYGAEEREYDAVILATPVEFTDITFKNFASFTPSLFRAAEEDSRTRTFTPLYVSYYRGHYRPQYFGYEKLDDVPMTVLATDHNVSPFTAITTVQIHEDGSRLVKFFSPQPLTEAVLSRIFEDVSEAFIHFWEIGAYYSLPSEPPLPPVVIAPRFYYTAAFESVMSVMEAAALAGRNSARLLFEDLLK